MYHVLLLIFFLRTSNDESMLLLPDIVSKYSHLYTHPPTRLYLRLLSNGSLVDVGCGQCHLTALGHRIRGGNDGELAVAPYKTRRKSQVPTNQTRSPLHPHWNNGTDCFQEVPSPPLFPVEKERPYGEHGFFLSSFFDFFDFFDFLFFLRVLRQRKRYLAPDPRSHRIVPEAAEEFRATVSKNSKRAFTPPLLSSSISPF